MHRPQDTTPDLLRHILRAQAWERAKGAMHEVIATYYGDQEKFAAFDKAMKEFVKAAEGEGWVE